MDFRSINVSRYHYTWEFEIRNGYHPPVKKKSFWKGFIKWMTQKSTMPMQ